MNDDTETAINNTTVEVKFKENIDDIKSLDFKIEGLEVKNAAIKQTDKSVAVLTTSSQEGNKVYTVTANGKKLGTFKGVSAVLPTAIKMTTLSQQAIVGQEVTVKAEVTVPEGQSKAGIPVTFINQPSGTGSDVATNVVEVLTDENGVATYTYTRYYGGEDTVTAYATGKTEVRASAGKVYWGIKERLTVTEVTEGNELQNGSKKVYKVKATTGSGSALANQFVNIAFAENIDVTPDKGVSGVQVLDANGVNLGYPYQYTTSAKRTVSIKLNADGEATFTLTGADETVTPIVYVDTTSAGTVSENASAKLDANELQVKLPALKFAAVQNVEVAVESLGKAEAAAIQLGDRTTGGRDYVATLKYKDGKVLPEGTTVYVTLNNNFAKNIYLLDENGNVVENTPFAEVTTTSPKSVTVKPLTVGKNGQVKFTLTGEFDGFAQPIVFADNNNNGVLNSSDAQAAGEYVYFGKAEVTSSELVVRQSAAEGSKEISTLTDSENAYFHYQVTDQNGKKHITTQTVVTYEVTNNGAKPITVDGRTVAAFGGKISFSRTTNAQGHDVVVVDGNGESTVTINASASHATIANTSASVKFTNSTELANPYTGTITHLDANKDQKTVAFDNQTTKKVSYKAATINYNGRTLTEAEFETLLDNHKVVAKYSKDAIGIVTIDVISATANTEFTYIAASTDKTYVNGITSTLSKDENGNGKVDVGDEITFTVNYTAAVTDTEVPRLLLNVGGTKAEYDSGSETNTLTYIYTAEAGDVSSNISVTGLELGTGVTTVDATASYATGLSVDLLGPTVTKNDITTTNEKLFVKFSEGLYYSNGTEYVELLPTSPVSPYEANFEAKFGSETLSGQAAVSSAVYNPSTDTFELTLSAEVIAALTTNNVVTLSFKNPTVKLTDAFGNVAPDMTATLTWDQGKIYVVSVTSSL